MVVQTQLVASEPSVVQNILPQTSQNAVVYNSNAPPTSGIHTLVNAGNGTILTGTIQIAGLNVSLLSFPFLI